MGSSGISTFKKWIFIFQNSLSLQALRDTSVPAGHFLGHVGVHAHDVSPVPGAATLAAAGAAQKPPNFGLVPFQPSPRNCRLDCSRCFHSSAPFVYV
jgi:hypothetical protein